MMPSEERDQIRRQFSDELMDMRAMPPAHTLPARIDTWRTDRCRDFPELAAEVRSLADIASSFLHHPPPTPTPNISIVGNQNIVNTGDNSMSKATAGNLNQSVVVTQLHGISDSKPKRQFPWELVITFCATFAIAASWFAPMPRWVPTCLTIAAAAVCLSQWFGFRRRIWEKTSFLWLSGLLLLDVTFRSVIQDYLDLLLFGKESDEDLIVTSVKLIAAVAFGLFALKAKPIK